MLTMAERTGSPSVGTGDEKFWGTVIPIAIAVADALTKSGGPAASKSTVAPQPAQSKDWEALIPLAVEIVRALSKGDVGGGAKSASVSGGPEADEKFWGTVIPIAIAVADALTKSGAAAPSEKWILPDFPRFPDLPGFPGPFNPGPIRDPWMFSKSASGGDAEKWGWIVPVAIAVARELTKGGAAPNTKSASVAGNEAVDEKWLGDVVRIAVSVAGALL